MRRADREFDDELEAHLELLTERFLRQGMTPEEAALAARRQFGGVTKVRQERRESRALHQIDVLLQDLSHGIRMLAKTPGFTATAVAALTLGIGANTAIFSVVDAVLLRPLEAPAADRMVRFLDTYQGVVSSTASLPQFNVWRQQTGMFQDVSAHRLELVNLTDVQNPEQIPLARVSAGFFRLFGAPVLQGRTFTPEEDRPGGGRVAILSYEFWVRRFGSNPQVLGQSVKLGNDPYIVAGILAAGFDSEQFDPLPDVWVPFQVDPETAEQGSYCTVTGRLKPGITMAMAVQQLKPVAEEYRRMLPVFNAQLGFTVEPLRDATVGDVRPSLILLLAAVSFVLLIACANVANLLLARAAGRKREMAIRAASGASRGRIVRQLLTESLMLSVTGGGLGLVLGLIAIRTLLALYTGGVSLPTPGYPIHIPRIGAAASAVTLDWRVFAFTALVSVVTGLVFGIIPALQSSRADLNMTLKTGGGYAGTGFRQNKTRALFVIGEMACALVLLVGAALLIRTYIALHSVNTGFDTRHVLATQMSVTGTRFEKTGDLDALVRDGVERIRSLPGVAHASAACCIPLETVWQLPFIVEGRPLTGSYHAFAGWTFISPEYFDTFRIPIMRGRAFSDRDNSSAPGVVIINQAMARQFWPDGDPLNSRLIIGRGMRPEYASDTDRQIIGIAGDIRDAGLQRDPRPAMYVPIAQLPDAANVINLRLLPIAWFVRAQSHTHALDSTIQTELKQASGGLPAAAVRVMDQVARQSTARTQFQMLLMTIFGGAALLLASIGIYGLMAYSVEQRRREIGIRLALGAQTGSLRRMVLLQGIGVASIGVAVGVAASFGLSRLLAGFLFGVRAWDAYVFSSVPLLLGAVAVAAIWLPAGRVTKVDPVTAMRHE